MGDTQSAPRDAEQDAERDTDSGQAQDSGDCNVEDKLLQNDTQISGLHGKSDGPLAELNDHLEDEFSDDQSALVSAREDVSDTFATVDDKEALLEDVEINDVTDSDPDADEAALNDQEDKMNEINKGFRRFFSNISLKLTLKQGPDEKQAEKASDVLPNGEEVPCSPGDTCDVANENTSETCENNADPHTAQDSADNESTTCPTVTDMTSEENIQENVEHKTPTATEVNQEATEGILAQADTEGVTSEVKPEGSCPQDSAEEEVLSPIKVFFTTGIFTSLQKKKKPAEEESLKNKTNEKESVDMDREEQGGTEEIGKDLAKDEVFPNAERAVVEEKQKTKDGIEEVIRESAPTNNGHGTGENLANANDELLSSEEKVKFPSSSLQRLLSGANLKVSTKQRGRKKSSDSVERITCPLQSSVDSTESTTEESPAVAPEEVNKLEESAWETFKRLLTPKKFQKKSTLSNEDVVSSKPEEPKLSEGEEIEDGNTEESRKRKDSIVSWDSLLCGSGNRRSRKSSNADEQKARTEGDDNRQATESRHATDLDNSHEMDDNLASSPEQGRSPSDDEGSTWKSLKRLVTPKRKSRDGEESKEHTSDSEVIQDESSFSLKKFLPGRKKRRPYEQQEEVPSDKPERGEHSDSEDSDTPAIIPLSEFDIPETESQVKIQAVLESQTPEAEAHKEQEELTGQTTEAMCDSTPALPKETNDTETALENLTSTTPASMEEVDDLTEFVSKLQQLSDIPEEGLIEESIATPASFADDAARDDTIADVIEFTSEAVTAPEPIDITVEDETEMVSAVSQLTDSSKTSGNTTPVPADYDVKETDNLLHQVVDSISATQNDTLESASDQSSERIAVSVSSHILETKELTILKTHQTSNATLLCTGFTVQVFDANDRVAEAECFSDMTETIYTQCLSEETTEEFHTAGISVDEELKYIKESQFVAYSSSDDNKAKISAVFPQAEDVNVSEISIDDHKNNEQAHEMAPPGTDSYVEATIQTDNEALPQNNEALEDQYDQIKENRTDDEAQVESEEMVDESETLTLTDACASINSEATPTDEIAKGSHLLSGEQMQDVAELSVGYEERHELLVVKVGVAEFAHVPVSTAIEPEEVIMKADKTKSQLQSCSSVDVGQAEQGVQELQSQSMTEDIPEQDSTVPDSSTSTEAKEQIEHTPLETEMYMKQDVAEILQDALCEGGDQTTEVTGELQTETSVEEAVYCEESNVQVLEHKVITEDSPVLEDLTEKHLAIGEQEPTEVPQHISVEEDELEVLSIHTPAVIHDETEDIAESQAEVAKTEDEKEAAIFTEQGFAEKELISREDDPCDVPRQVLIQEDGKLTEGTDELKTSQSVHLGTLNSEARNVEFHQTVITSEDIIGSLTENACTSITDADEKETATQSKQSLLSKEFVETVESVVSEELTEISVTDYVQVADVTGSNSLVTSSNEASVDSNTAIVEVLEKQVVSEDIPEQDGSSAHVTDKVENETGILIERALVEKPPTMVYDDPNEIPQQSVAKQEAEVVNVSTEFENPPAVQIAPLIPLFSIVEGIEKQVTSQNLLSNAENTDPVITVEDEKATVTVESDFSEEPQHISVTGAVQVAEVTKKLDPPTHIHLASVDSNAGIIEVLGNQVLPGDMPEGSSVSVTAEVENETGVLTEEAIVVEELPTMDCDPNEIIPQRVPKSVVKEDDEVVKVSTEFEAPPTLHTAPLISESSIVEIIVEQVTFEDLGSNAENAQPVITVEEDKESVTQPEQCLLEKELVVVESDFIEEPQHISITDVVQIADITKELEESTSIDVVSVEDNAGIEIHEKQDISEDIQVHDVASASVTAQIENETELPTQQAPPAVQIAPLIPLFSIVEGIEKQVTSQNLLSNAENADPVITVEDEKATVTQPEQSLMEKELLTVESDFSEEPQHISVTDDVQVAEVIKKLDLPTHIHLASVDSNAGIVEVLGNQVLPGDMPEGSSVSVTAEVENETGVLSEEAVVVEEPPTMDYDPNEIPQQSVVKDGEVVKVSTEFEAPSTLHTAPLISESSIVEIIEQVTFEDLGSNAENAQPISTVEEDKETVTQPEQCLLDKELVVVESDLIEEPQHISVKDVVQIADITKELEESTSIGVVSVEDNAGIVEVLKKQDISEDIQVHNVASASVTAQIENETELPTQQAPPAVQIAPLIPLFSIVEGIEKQITSQNLLSNAENADPVITIEDEKATVTQPEQSLMEKELLTVESDFSEEPQHISVTDDVQVAEVTKKLDLPTHIHLASVDSNAGIVEVLGNQVLPGDMPEGSSVSVTAEVENETGVLTEEAIVVEEPPTMDYDPNEIPQQSVVKDGEVVKVSTEFEAPSHVQMTPLILDSSIVEVIEKQVTEDLGSDAENANTLFTVESEQVMQSEQSLLVKESVTVESNINEEPQHISVTDVQVTEFTKELEASTFVQVASLDSNAGIVEILEKEVVSENIAVPNGASVSVTAVVENKTEVLLQVVGGKALPTGDDGPNEIPQQSVIKQDGQVVQTESEAPPTVPLILGSSMVEVIGKQVLSEDIPVTDREKATASTTAEAEEEAAVLIAQALVEKVLRTVVGDPDEIPRQCAVKNDDEFADITKLLDGSTEVDIASINSDTSTSQVLQKHVLSEVIPTPDTDNAAVTSVTEVTEVPEVYEKQHVEDHVALVPEVVPEPSHEVGSTAVNDEGDINKLAEVEENAEIVEDGAAMQDEDGAAMQECGIKTSKGDDADRETPNLREPLLDVMATEEEPQDTVEPARVLKPCVQEGMMEMAEKSKGDVEVKSAEEVGATDAKGAMDIGCKVQNEVENVSTSLAAEEILDKMDNVTTKEVNQQENQTEVSEEGAKEESCLKEEPVSAVQVIVTPPTDKQEATEIIQSEPSELEAQKVTENKSDVSIERPAPEVLPVTEIGNDEETASINVFVTTDDVSIDKLKPDLYETKVELKKESHKNVIEEDSSCSPELLPANETIEAKQDTVVPQIITSSEKVQPTTEMGVEEIQATENGVESNIQMELTELQVKEKEIEVTEPQVLEKVEPNIQKEVKELGTEQKSEPLKQIQASEVKEEANVAPKIQMEGTEFPTTEKLESTLQMEETELQVTEEVEQNIKIALTNIKVTVKVVVQAIEELDLEESKVDAHLIEDSSFSPQEVAATEMMDAKQEQTHPCEMVTPTEEGEPTIKMEKTEIQLTKKVEPKIQMEVTELQGENKVEPTIEMEATEIQITKKVEPNIQIALTEMKDPLTQCQLPEVGVKADEAIEKARTIQMAEVPESLQKPCVSEVSVTQVIEVTGLVQEFDSTREMIQAEPVAPQVGSEQGEQGELEQDVWLDAEEDIGKKEGAEKTGNEPQESVQSNLEGSQEEEFLDTTGHAHIEEESSTEEIQAIGEIHEIEREGEDFAIALEDSQIRNLTETSLICKELD